MRINTRSLCLCMLIVAAWRRAVLCALASVDSRCDSLCAPSAVGDENCSADVYNSNSLSSTRSIDCVWQLSVMLEIHACRSSASGETITKRVNDDGTETEINHNITHNISDSASEAAKTSENSAKTGNIGGYTGDMYQTSSGPQPDKRDCNGPSQFISTPYSK